MVQPRRANCSGLSAHSLHPENKHTLRVCARASSCLGKTQPLLQTSWAEDKFFKKVLWGCKLSFYFSPL